MDANDLVLAAAKVQLAMVNAALNVHRMNRSRLSAYMSVPPCKDELVLLAQLHALDFVIADAKAAIEKRLEGAVS